MAEYGPQYLLCLHPLSQRTSVMSLHPHVIEPVPDETARIAHAAFPKGHPYLTFRDALGTILQVAYPGLADNSSGPLLSRPRGLSQPVVRSRNGFSAPCSCLLAC